MVKRGFSLIELLIVIAIIAILTAIATASYSTMQKKARDNRRISDMKAIQNGFEQYFADNTSSYPVSLPCFLGVTYFPNDFPTDPKPGWSYSYYCNGSTYCVCAKLEVESGNRQTDCGGVVGKFYCVSERQ
ncbi:MAG: prepilin-type N-terminal cleavage/methylation domain-containing protein [Candidatus Gottesmanbacteria bacterium]